MDIEILSDALYEDLNGRISAIDYSGNLEIYFLCDDWGDSEITRYFRITCHEVAESELQPSSTAEICFTDDHQLLWNHNESRSCLYLSAKAECRHEALGRLWETHEALFQGWRPLRDFLNPVALEASYGLLAQGSAVLMEHYRTALDGVVKTRQLNISDRKGAYKALIFDMCFVICKSVSVVEVTRDKIENPYGLQNVKKH